MFYKFHARIAGIGKVNNIKAGLLTLVSAGINVPLQFPPLRRLPLMSQIARWAQCFFRLHLPSWQLWLNASPQQAQGEQTTSDGASNIWVIYFMLALSCNEKSFSPHKWKACLFFVFMVQWKPHWREAGNLFFSNQESVPCVSLRATDCVWKCLVCGMS